MDWHVIACDFSERSLRAQYVLDTAWGSVYQDIKDVVSNCKSRPQTRVSSMVE